MRIICAANMKGGAGKSATTCWIANALATHSSVRILVIDADNQQTITKLRKEDELLAEETAFRWDLITAIPQQAETIIEDVYEKQTYDIVFIDMPRMTGLEDDAIISLLAMCDSFIIPIKASRPDTLALGDFMTTMGELKQIREAEGLPIYMYSYQNFYRNIRESKYLPAYSEEIGIRMMDNKIKHKKLFEFYDTYTSLLEIEDGIEDFLPFLQEFIEKYELDLVLEIPSSVNPA